MRTVIVTLLALLAVCALLPALAEEGEVNPERMTVLRNSQIAGTPQEHAVRVYTRIAVLTGIEPRDGETEPELDMTVVKTAAPSYTQGGSWTVTVNREGNWRYEYYFGEKNSVFGNSWVIHRQKTGSGNTYTSCPIVAPGEYRLVVNLYDADVSLTSRVKQKVYSYTIAPDADHPPLEDVVAGIVADCRGATDLDTALSLYDWLTHHAYYDKSLSFYGADGVLLRGYGTCDSYSKAYYLLLGEAGIDVTRVSGGNHAWNALLLDGSWYQCDATWDDPSVTGCTDPVSGYESHEYFCITDELMLESNHNYIPSASTPCTSLDMNYYVRFGGWERWNTGFLDDLRAALTAGKQAFGTTCPGESRRHLTILCWVLNTQPEAFAADDPGETLGFAYNYNAMCFSVARTDGRTIIGDWLCTVGDDYATVDGYLGLGNVLTVPDALADKPVAGLGPRAFWMDTRLHSLTLPESAVALGAEALWGCDSLTTLSMPDSITSVGTNALPAGRLTVCGADTELAHALGAVGYDIADPDLPDWQLRWHEGSSLVTTAYLGRDVLVELPEGFAGVMGLGSNISLQVLVLPDGACWLDAAMPLPRNLWLVLGGGIPPELDAWAQANGVCALDRAARSFLPQALTGIDAEAFAGMGLYWPVLPDGVQTVGENAFADCPGLKAVTFPAGPIQLPDALFGMSDPVILAPAGSPAAQWAVNHGYRVLMQ